MTGSASGELAIPESPGNVFEAWTILEGLFAFSKD